jgi:hypothetical protein
VVDPKINMYTKTNTIICKLMFVIVELFYGTWGRRERKGER